MRGADLGGRRTGGYSWIRAVQRDHAARFLDRLQRE
jgi:hypothetical protein